MARTASVNAARVVQLDHDAGLAARQEVGLSAAVVTDDGQAEGHRFQEHQAEPFVLAGRDEGVGDRERRIFVRVRDLSRQVHPFRNAELGRALLDRGASGPSPTTSRCAFGIALAASTSISCVVALRATSRPIVTMTNASSGSPKVGRDAHHPRGRALDAERNEPDLPMHAVQLGDVTHGVARLAD